MKKYQKSRPHLAIIVCVFAGTLMLVASISPWLNDPLGSWYNAWQLPIYLGWVPRIATLTYGTLCVCCALLVFVSIFVRYKPFIIGQHSSQRYTLLGLLCLTPLIVFFTQYLLVDMQSINQLTQHKVQMLLIVGHYNYRVGTQIFVLKPFDMNIALLGDRFSLLIDQLSFGVLLPFVCSCLLFSCKRFSSPEEKNTHEWILYSLATLVVTILLGSAALGIICEKQAKQLLYEGNYIDALTWLDRAVSFNPSLDTVAFFHIDRGEAKYFLHPGQLDDDSLIYLASRYRERKNYIETYRQIESVLSVHKNAPSWVNDDMNIALEELVEDAGPLKQHASVLDAKEQGLRGDDAALKWLQPLAQLYPNNLYAAYMLGRVHYEMRNYSVCKMQMYKVIQLSPDRDLLSSAYTYIALSDIGQRNYALGRAELLTAIDLDINYHNTAAREEMSGIR